MVVVSVITTIIKIESDQNDYSNGHDNDHNGVDNIDNNNVNDKNDYNNTNHEIVMQISIAVLVIRILLTANTKKRKLYHLFTRKHRLKHPYLKLE